MGCCKIGTAVFLLVVCHGQSVWATTMITPSNISQQHRQISISTHFTAGRPAHSGYPVSSGDQIEFEVRAMTAIPDFQIAGTAHLTLSDQNGVVAEVPISGEIENNACSYRFTVARNMLENSIFEFQFGESYSLSLSDWRSPESPLSGAFEVVKGAVAPGDTFVVNIEVLSVEQATFYVDHQKNMEWRLLDCEDRVIAHEPMIITDKWNSLEFQEGQSRTFAFQIPATYPSNQLSSAEAIPLEPGKYRAQCSIELFGPYAFASEFELEVQ